MRCAILACGVLAAVGCSKKTQDGLPPATEWQAASGAEPSPGPRPSAELTPPLTPPPGMGGPARGRGNLHAGMDLGGEGDPHAGLDLGGEGDPHAGLDLDGEGDPHAGLDMSGGNPHGGGGTDVTKLGLAAPDPDRPIAPGHRVAGVIGVDPKARAHVKPGAAVFLIVKRAGADGAPSGPPLAVDKLTWSGDSVAFELTEAQAMVAGTELIGDVVVMARYDQDSDASSRQPGDVTGQVRVTIPAEHVKLTLDTVLP